MAVIAAPGVGYSTFRQIFLPGEGRRVRLRIPDYQRAYDWREEQRLDLFRDLERLADFSRTARFDESSGHFCGTVICTPSSNPGDGLRYDVVDGQQRLTTLVLLHSCLARATGSDPFVVSGDNALFRPQSVDADFFTGIAKANRRDAPDSSGQKRYREAADEIGTWMSGLGHGTAVDEMRVLVEDRLQFIFFVLPDGNEASKVFETINNRGKPLTQMDLVKNHLIYMQSVHGWDGSVEATWSDIQKETAATRFRGDEDVDTVLRAAVTAMFHHNQRKRGETDYRIIKREVQDREHGVRFERFLAFLKVSFRTFRRLRDSFETRRNDPVATQLTYLNQHPSISGVLPLIFARQFWRGDESGADVLEAVEKANFRLYGLMNASKKSNSYHVPLHGLAHEYFGKHCEARHAPTSGRTNPDASALIDSLTAVVAANHKDGFGQIVKALTLDDDDPADFHRWGALRYFLARWEDDMLKNQSFAYGQLANEMGECHSNDYLAREHIHPGSTTGPLADYKDGLLLRRLGNFMLLPQGVNVGLSNDTVDVKCEALPGHSRTNSLLVQNKMLKDFVESAATFRDALERADSADFGRERKYRFHKSDIETNGDVAAAKTLCDLREEEMVRFALRAWRMPGERLGEQAGEQFLGMFSFGFKDEAYQSDKEGPANKEVTNYVLGDVTGADGGNERLDALKERLRRRNELLGLAPEPAVWPEQASGAPPSRPPVDLAS